MSESPKVAPDLTEKLAFINNMALVLDVFMKCQFPGALAPSAMKAMQWVEGMVKAGVEQARLHPDAHLIEGLLPKDEKTETIKE